MILDRTTTRKKTFEVDEFKRDVCIKCGRPYIVYEKEGTVNRIVLCSDSRCSGIESEELRSWKIKK